MTVEAIREQVLAFHREGKRMFVSSSFQTHSIPLLHILSTIPAPVDVLFIHTGFHFPETLQFRDDIIRLLGLPLINVRSQVPKSQQRDMLGRFYYASDPDYCCYMNKVQSLEPYLMQYDVWINGVRADQSETRKKMRVVQEAPFNTLRFHPMLDWNSKMIFDYRKEHQLPEHPLEQQGYLSIGCEPCTRKFSLDPDDRSGRWAGMKKSECGLHTELIKPAK